MVKSEQVKEVAHLFSCVGHFLNAGAFGVYFALKKKKGLTDSVSSRFSLACFFFFFRGKAYLIVFFFWCDKRTCRSLMMQSSAERFQACLKCHRGAKKLLTQALMYVVSGCNAALCFFFFFFKRWTDLSLFFALPFFLFSDFFFLYTLESASTAT